MGMDVGDLDASMPIDEEPASPLTPEALDLLAKVDEGGVPAFATNNLRRIARQAVEKGPGKP